MHYTRKWTGKMKAKEILNECMMILDDRGRERDQKDGEMSFHRAADIFNMEHLDVKLSPRDVAAVMVSIKRARIMTERENGILNHDSWLDLINYTAIAYELLNSEHKDIDDGTDSNG